MKRKKFLYLSILVPLLVVLFFHKDLISYYEDYKVEIFINESNEYLVNRMDADEQYRLNMTKGEKKIKDDKRNRFVELAASRAVEIDFFGKIIDQYGEPVAGAIVEFYGTSGFLVEGSGFGKAQTDINGIFHISDSSGTKLSFKKLYKNGYEIKLSSGSNGNIFESYQRFDDSLLLDNYSSKSTAFVFDAWKKEIIANILSSGYNKAFLINNKDYWVDFTIMGVKQSLGKTPDSMKVNFSQDGDDITLHLSMLEGKLLETEKTQYMNIAPESGYQNEYFYTFNGSERGNKPTSKYFFYKTAGKGFYGRVEMVIRPNFKRFKKGYIRFKYLTNLDQTTALYKP